MTCLLGQTATTVSTETMLKKFWFIGRRQAERESLFRESRFNPSEARGERVPTYSMGTRQLTGIFTTRRGRLLGTQGLDLFRSAEICYDWTAIHVAQDGCIVPRPQHCCCRTKPVPTIFQGASPGDAGVPSAESLIAGAQRIPTIPPRSGGAAAAPTLPSFVPSWTFPQRRLPAWTTTVVVSSEIPGCGDVELMTVTIDYSCGSTDDTPSASAAKTGNAEGLQRMVETGYHWSVAVLESAAS
eukprot:g5318.t1